MVLLYSIVVTSIYMYLDDSIDYYILKYAAG